MIKVLLADDEDLVRSGLRTILSSAGDIEVVAECDDGLYVADLARQHRPHVVLLDIRMRSADGIVALRRLRSLPEPPVVAMLTTFDVDEYVQEALRIGASGFLLKDTEPSVLVKAVRDLSRGGAVLDPKVAARVLSAVGGPGRCRAGRERPPLIRPVVSHRRPGARTSARAPVRSRPAACCSRCPTGSARSLP